MSCMVEKKPKKKKKKLNLFDLWLDFAFWEYFFPFSDLTKIYVKSAVWQIFQITFAKKSFWFPPPKILISFFFFSEE